MHASILQWSNYFMSMAGSAAAMVGFLFIGLTISLNKFLDYKHLPARALQSLIFLLTILIISTLGLVPGQSYSEYGAEILGIWLITVVVNSLLHVNMVKNTQKEHKKYVRINLVFSLLANMLYLPAGIIIIRYGYNGIYWLIPAFFFSFIKALLDSWVLVVEVNR